MTNRRARGEGGLHWDESRQRWIATVTVGYTPAGKRIVRKGSGKTKTEARTKLREKIRDYEDGLAIAEHHYTVTDAITDWLTYGLNGRSDRTKSKYEILCRTHITPALGARKLRELRAQDVDRWLADKATTLSTRTLGELHGCLNRSVNRAMARDKVKRNVVALCTVPRGQEGRPSESLTLAQAHAVLNAAMSTRLHAYVVLSLLTGARTEELRALRWDHVDLDGRPDLNPPLPPSVNVWHSVRDGGDTKTKKSRRTLALPQRCVTALRLHREQQNHDRVEAGKDWQSLGLVFTTTVGTALDAANVRRAFRRVVTLAGLDPAGWTPRDLRHSFVSLLSDQGVPLEAIADLCGHAGTTVTEKVYRHQLRPVLLGGAQVMDAIFGEKP
ncbi:tyrosine recombinase XerC [Micromonospora sp. 4G55]|uniref:site-specific integrase n=1 Tax=Micromonospora sp. 4G55 TaxID=2806102 RepID=UPI001A5BC185|nr:site-specific integrase [Micromonospora sp. 4G55]MBM0256490.1 tyrosine-type recombinase/integrase [Micromonospora sp. 4G55]